MIQSCLWISAPDEYKEYVVKIHCDLIMETKYLSVFLIAFLL